MKVIPSVSDIILFVGVGMLATGISIEWGWPIAAEVIGIIFIAFSILAKLRGND